MAKPLEISAYLRYNKGKGRNAQSERTFSMTDIKKIISELSSSLHIELNCYAENTRPKDVPVCDKQFEGICDDGENTFFRFVYQNVGYIGVIAGVGEMQNGYARLLPAYVENFTGKDNEISKVSTLKRIMLGEGSSMLAYKYAVRFSVRGYSAFVIVLRLQRLTDEALAVLQQYGGNSLDTLIKIGQNTWALVKFVGDDDEYRSSMDYADFLIQSLQEETGIEAKAGVGPTVKELKDLSTSYEAAENALRYADLFETKGAVHSYREFILIRLLEGLPEGKLSKLFAEMTDKGALEAFEDKELMMTAEEFLQNSLNVSETARNLYMHRNTLTYRLDKLEKATGLNIRQFSDAVSFRVFTLLYKLMNK